jgi:hypothetical protein
MDIYQIVRENETNYKSSPVLLSKYVQHSLSETIDTIDAYLNSKHISGDTDSLGREKPFFNICVGQRNIWYRATDLDRKNIKIKATKSADIFYDFLATVHLQNWMRKEKFGTFLNDWGLTLSSYGSAVCKFIEKGGRLIPSVIAWNRLIVDPIDFDNDVVIEVLEMTPAQLRKNKNYDQDLVEKLIEKSDKRETLGGLKKDNKSGFIKVYEVHGEMPLSFLTDREEDENTYVQQVQVVAYTAGKEKGQFDDYTLYKGKESKHPYMITHLIKEDGRTLSKGAVENILEPQWMLNHTSKQIKDQLDLASKLIFQTSDGNFIGQNALNDILTGDILIHSPNQPLTQIANSSHDITSLQNYGMQWKTLSNEINGVSEAMMGASAKSGTAWRQTEALLQESHDLFALMTENKGLHLEDMLREYILPHIKKKMDTTEEISATLDSYNIEKIDKNYVPYTVTKSLAKKLIEHIGKTGRIPLIDENTINQEAEQVEKFQSSFGSQRFFSPSEVKDKTWKEAFKDFEWEVEVDITGEQKDNIADMATLSTIFQTVAMNPQILENPKAKTIFNKILLKTGTVSPIELAEIDSQPTMSGAPSGGGSAPDMGKLVETQK